MSPENERDLRFLFGFAKGYILVILSPFILMGVIFAGIFIDAIIYGIGITIIKEFNTLMHMFH